MTGPYPHPHPHRTTKERLIGATRVAARMTDDYEEWKEENSHRGKGPGKEPIHKEKQIRLQLQLEWVAKLIKIDARENAREQRREERHARHEERREQRREQRENARAEREELRKIVVGLSDALQNEVQPRPIVPPVWQRAQHAREERQYTYLTNNAATHAVSAAAERQLASIPSRASVDSVMPWDTPPELPKSAPPPLRRPPPPSSPAPSVLSSAPAENPAPPVAPSAAAPSSKPLPAPFRYVKRSALSANTPPEPSATTTAVASNAATPAVDHPNYGRVPASAIPSVDSPVAASPGAAVAPTPKPAPKPASIYASRIDALYKKGPEGDMAREEQKQKDEADAALRAKGYHPETFHPDYGKIPNELRTIRETVRPDNQRPHEGQYATLPVAPTNVVAPSADYGSVAPEAADAEGSALPRTPQEARDRITAAGAFTDSAPGRTVQYIPAGDSEYGNFGFISRDEPPPNVDPTEYVATSPAVAVPAAPVNADEYGRQPSDPGYGVLPPGVASSDSFSQWSEVGHDGSNISTGSEAVYDRIVPLPDDEAKVSNDNNDLPPITTAERFAASVRYRQDPGQFGDDYGMLPREGSVGGNYGAMPEVAPPLSAATSSTAVTRPRANAMSSADPATNYGAMPSHPSQGSLSSNSSVSSMQGGEVSVAARAVGWDGAQSTGANKRHQKEEQSPERIQASRSLADKMRDLWRFVRGKSAAANSDINDNDKDLAFNEGRTEVHDVS